MERLVKGSKRPTKKERARKFKQVMHELVALCDRYQVCLTFDKYEGQVAVDNDEDNTSEFSWGTALGDFKEVNKTGWKESKTRVVNVDLQRGILDEQTDTDREVENRPVHSRFSKGPGNIPF